MQYSSFLLFAITICLGTSPLIAQFQSNTWYRLTTQWQGECKSLDIVNDGNNNQPILAKTGALWRAILENFTHWYFGILSLDHPMARRMEKA